MLKFFYHRLFLMGGGGAGVLNRKLGQGCLLFILRLSIPKLDRYDSIYSNLKSGLFQYNIYIHIYIKYI